MLANALEKWLSKPDFTSGLEILKKYSRNKAILFFFENKMYGLDRMVTEVKKIEITATNPSNKTIAAEKIPAVIQGIIDSKNLAWKEARDLHSKLMAEPSKSVRFNMAKRIVELSALVKAAWEKIDRYNASGSYAFLNENVVAATKPDLHKLFSDKILKQNYIVKAKRELLQLQDPEKKQNKSTHLATLESDLLVTNNRIDFLNAYIIEHNL